MSGLGEAVRLFLLAERLRHPAVIDPLAAGRGALAGLHANTQIPKVIGYQRIEPVTQEQLNELCGW